jgi:integrase
VKETKTDNPREMPVHPTLARILAAWKLGFERLTGREPNPDDLILPSRRGKHRNSNHMLNRFHEDLERLGQRARRQHDARRTFISIARADGARPDILRWVTHGPTGDITDQYTTLPWLFVKKGGRTRPGRGISP